MLILIKENSDNYIQIPFYIFLFYSDALKVELLATKDGRNVHEQRFDQQIIKTFLEVKTRFLNQ